MNHNTKATTARKVMQDYKQLPPEDKDRINMVIATLLAKAAQTNKTA